MKKKIAALALIVAMVGLAVAHTEMGRETVVDGEEEWLYGYMQECLDPERHYWHTPEHHGSLEQWIMDPDGLEEYGHHSGMGWTGHHGRY